MNPTPASVPLVLLSGGLGTRLGPLTQNQPKALVEVAGDPFIFHQLRILKREKIETVVICAAHQGKEIQSAVGDGSKFGLDIKYSFDGDKLLGTGGAVRHTLSELGDAFWTLYGDSYLDVSYAPVFEYFSSQRCLGLMTVFCNNNRWVPSNVLFQDGRILRYDKAHPTSDMHHVDFGLGLWRRDAFGAWRDGDVFDLSAVHERLIAQGELLGFEMTKRFYEIGTPEGLQETETYIKGTKLT